MARDAGKSSGWWPFSLFGSSPEERDLSERSSKALVAHWNAMLYQLRPESKRLLDGIAIVMVSRGEIKKKTGRDADARYDWINNKVLVNSALVGELRKEVVARVGEAAADLALAALYLHVLDHEIAGHAGVVAKMREAHGKYIGMVLEEELYAYITEAEGLARCYQDPPCSKALDGVRDLADKRHEEILQAVPRGIEGFEQLVRAKGYRLPTVQAKAQEYWDTASDIESRLSDTESNRRIVEMRRNSASNLVSFYANERNRLAEVLQSLRL